MKKTLSVLLAFILCLSPFLFAFCETDEVTVSNPYENINWADVSQYKTALHTHTNASDGKQTLEQSIQKHIDCGFDIVSISDHGISDTGWALSTPPFFSGVFKLLGRSDGKTRYLCEEGVFENAGSYSYSTNTNGDDYVTLENGRKILRVPYAIENNAVSVNAHVNSWFVPYKDNSVNTYADAVRAVTRAGGVCVINHPGEYTKAKNELTSETAYNESDPSYAYYINKYAYLIDKYDGCIGIDINSKGDSRTKYDRILWDKLLERFSAKGKNVFAVASSDAHVTSIIDSGFVIALMESLDSKSLRSALENGEFFAASHCIGNYDELIQIQNSIKEFYGETEIYAALKETTDKIKAVVDAITSGSLPADEHPDIRYSLLDSDGNNIAKTSPEITLVTVDNESGTIRIESENALIVRWISNGRLIETDKADKADFCVSENRNCVGDYVRAEIFGEGGIIYTQAFLINEQQKAHDQKVTRGVFLDLGIFDFLLGEIRNAVTIAKIYFRTVLP